MASRTKFKFRWLVELLENLDLAKKGQPLSLDLARQYALAWFKEHGDKINRHGPSAIAFLACILPNRLPHRTYGLRERRLATVVSDALYLPERGPRRMKLKYWTSELDFPTLVEEVMREAENLPPSAKKQVTLEEIDAAFCELAANSGFSAPELECFRTNRARHEILRPIILRLGSVEGKWLMRMILKSYSPALIPEQTILQSFHFLLPNLLVIQNSLEAAVDTLGREDLQNIPPNPPMEERAGFYQLATRHMHPKLGVMIQRQPYHKARSIKHCCDMVGGRTMSVERKYDGEYCQIHIDLSKPEDERIQIFSKSGKDSTRDRENLHWAIEDSLLLDDSKCNIKENCILEGELLVWNRSKEEIQPFHVIRKHVLHGGRSIGIAADSPRNVDDHLMIMYYDLLYLDNESWLNTSLTLRRSRLEQVVKQISGVGQIGTRVVQNFGIRDAQKALCDQFVRSIKERWEGLVLKGLGDPYFSWERRPRVIKLKQDYVTGLAHTIDLCIVGGFREQLVVDQLEVGDLSWTSFYLASFENKDEVQEFHVRPTFRVVDVLHHQGISKIDILHINREGRYRKIDSSESSEYFDISFLPKDFRRSAQLFKDPFVVEVMGAGFEKPQDAAYFTLRFPRAKLHTDRTFLDTNSFDELQAMARDSFKVANDSDSEDILRRIQKANGKHRIVDKASQETSPMRTNSSAISTPCKSTSVFPKPLTAETEIPITPPQLNRHSRDIREETSHSEASMSISKGKGKQVMPKIVRPSFPPSRVHSPHTAWNDNTSNDADAADSLMRLSETTHPNPRIIMPIPRSLDRGNFDAVEPYNGPKTFSPPPSFNPPDRFYPTARFNPPRFTTTEPYNGPKTFSPPPFFKDPRTFQPPGLSESEAQFYLPEPSHAAHFRPPGPLHHSHSSYILHPRESRDPSTGFPLASYTLAPDDPRPPDHFRTQSESQIQAHLQPPQPSNHPTEFRGLDRMSGRALDLYLDSRSSTRFPLTEIPNAPEQRGSKRPPPDDGSGELPDTPNATQSRKKKYHASGLRGGASSSDMLTHTFAKKRLQCTDSNNTTSTGKRTQILAHICRNPSSTAASSICRILTSHWFIETENGIFGGRSGCNCSDCRLILIVVADDSRLRDVAREIQNISTAVVSIREQALEKESFNPKPVISTSRSWERDQKLVIFLSKTARSVLFKLEEEVKARQTRITPTGCEWYMTELNRAFRTHFAGAIHFSFPKPFFSPTMALTLFGDGAGEVPGFTPQDIDKIRRLSTGLVAPRLSIETLRSVTCSVKVRACDDEVASRLSNPGTVATGSKFPTTPEVLQSETQGSAEVEWKWSRVLKLMGSLGCDAVNI